MHIVALTLAALFLFVLLLTLVAAASPNDSSTDRLEGLVEWGMVLAFVGTALALVTVAS